ncbi:P-loop NTPase family protein [Sediminitomix flava]|uniref:Cellulose biosynthesis protein BcsQ n=1 Tax=Sediminitomix flava TaxID=379075 RepID=A0A315YZ75_SEDFL|nr:hypothetical protein [Sediminitomix flava]PWJ34208.1 hypothetical protein BC781_111118 [Sediminitomix flava]
MKRIRLGKKNFLRKRQNKERKNDPTPSTQTATLNDKPQTKKLDSNNQYPMKKTINFITQSKGGVGKSTFTYMIANKVMKENATNAVFFDMDPESQSTLQLCDFTNPSKVDLLKSNESDIDRTKFDDFLYDFAEQTTYNECFCDMGAETSKHFVRYLQGDGVLEVIEDIKSMNIQVNVYCVLGGNGDFFPSIQYCEELFGASKEVFSPCIVMNRYYQYKVDAIDKINEVANQFDAEVREFRVLHEEGTEAMSQILQIMGEGKPAYTEAKRGAKIRFNSVLDDFIFRLPSLN